MKAADAHGQLDWRMLAAIGVRESGFDKAKRERLKDGSIGPGRGAFQIDLSKNPTVSETAAFNLSWAADWAAQRLDENRTALAAAHPNLISFYPLWATAASWNLGVGGISGNPNTIDNGSAHGNYGSNVLGLIDCFK